MKITDSNRAQASRRHFLRGAGVALALPWMESLPLLGAEGAKPAVKAASNKPPVRFATIYFSNGVEPIHWWAKGSGASMELGPVLQPMMPYREDFTFLRGLFNKQAVLSTSPHLGRMPNLLSGATVSLDPADIRVGTTFDQVLSQQIGNQTAVPSLALGIEPNELRLEDGVSMIYGSCISWATPTKPATKEIYPARTFDLLVGDGKGRQVDRSILDAVLKETHELQPKISRGDRRKLDEYLESVRSIETRIERASREERGTCFGLFPIGWIVIGAVFLYLLTVESGQFDIVKSSVVALSPDHRIQALLIAFCFGAFVEGAAGFGTPVAISGALLMGAGFPPLEAAGLTLIANTAPVAFGALGTPIVTLAKVTGLPEMQLSAMAGRQLPLFAFLIPGWLVVTMSGWKGLRGVWPAVLVSGGTFAIVQFFVSNYLGPALTDVAGGLLSMLVLALLLTVWRPREMWQYARSNDRVATLEEHRRHYSANEIARAWAPWLILSLCVVVWGLPPVRTVFDGGKPELALHWYERPNILAGMSEKKWKVPFLDQLIKPDAKVIGGEGIPKPAEFRFNWLSATGTGIFVAAILSALWVGTSPYRFGRLFLLTIYRLRWSLITIACMLAIAYVTQYSGSDVTLGLAFTRTGRLYPFFAAMLGWLGVALTGSDTSSNALFGNLQRVTAERLGLNPILICTANSTGGVMGKMIDAQSIVVASAATGQHGQEGRILRFVFWHSLILASLVGIVTLLQAYVLTAMIPKL